MPKPEASKKYESLRDDISDKIGSISSRLWAHEKRQRINPEHWSYAGDLDHVLSGLRDIDTFLAGIE